MSRPPFERRLHVLQTHVVDPHGHGMNGLGDERNEQTVGLQGVKSVSRYVGWGLMGRVLKTVSLLVKYAVAVLPGMTQFFAYVLQ